MLQKHHRLAIYMEGNLSLDYGKMGLGVLRYSPNEVVCVVDSTNAGKNVQQVVNIPRSCPVVATHKEAKSLGADALVIGIAPHGGKLPPEWLPALDEAVALGLSIVNGLHDTLAQRYPKLQKNQFVWDIRKEPKDVPVGMAEARHLKNKRLLTVGTDMSVGKMTAGLEIVRAARERGVRAEFVATGQIGITIWGSGVALDAVRVDFASGALEAEVMKVKDAELIVVEGQGALCHPSSSATLPLLRGSCPTHLLMCHRADQTALKRAPCIEIPPLKEYIELYEDLAETVGTFPRPKTIGVSLNTMMLTESEARDSVSRFGDETGLPCTDPIRFGVEPLLGPLFGSK